MDSGSHSSCQHLSSSGPVASLGGSLRSGYMAS